MPPNATRPNRCARRARATSAVAQYLSFADAADGGAAPRGTRRGCSAVHRADVAADRVEEAVQPALPRAEAAGAGPAVRAPEDGFVAVLSPHAREAHRPTGQAPRPTAPRRTVRSGSPRRWSGPGRARATAHGRTGDPRAVVDRAGDAAQQRRRIGVGGMGPDGDAPRAQRRPGRPPVQSCWSSSWTWSASVTRSAQHDRRPAANPVRCHLRGDELSAAGGGAGRLSTVPETPAPRSPPALQPAPRPARSSARRRLTAAATVDEKRMARRRRASTCCARSSGPAIWASPRSPTTPDSTSAPRTGSCRHCGPTASSTRTPHSERYRLGLTCGHGSVGARQPRPVHL